jgi:hypothetical protein
MSDSIGISISKSIQMIAHAQEGFQIKDWLPAIIAILTSLFALYIVKTQSDREFKNSLKIWRRQTEITLYAEWATSVRKATAKISHLITMALSHVSTLVSLPAFETQEKSDNFLKQKMENTFEISSQSFEYEMLMDRSNSVEESSYQRLYRIIKRIKELSENVNKRAITKLEFDTEMNSITEEQAEFMNDVKNVMLLRRQRIIEM